MRNDTQQPTYASWGRGVREVPDMLVAAQLSLGRLATGEATPSSAEGRRIVGDACALLRAALANLVDVTRSLPGFPLETSAGTHDGHHDPRMSPAAHAREVVAARPVEQCALTQRPARSFDGVPHVAAHLTDEELDRLRRCANGNTLRFESSDIVAALVAGGYATEGVGRVVTVTPEGLRYLESHRA